MVAVRVVLLDFDYVDNVAPPPPAAAADDVEALPSRTLCDLGAVAVDGDILVPVPGADADFVLDTPVPAADSTPDPPVQHLVAAHSAFGDPHRRCDPPWVDIRLAKNPQDAPREWPAMGLRKRRDPDHGGHLKNQRYSGPWIAHVPGVGTVVGTPPDDQLLRTLELSIERAFAVLVAARDGCSAVAGVCTAVPDGVALVDGAAGIVLRVTGRQRAPVAPIPGSPVQRESPSTAAGGSSNGPRIYWVPVPLVR